MVRDVRVDRLTHPHTLNNIHSGMEEDKGLRNPDKKIGLIRALGERERLNWFRFDQRYLSKKSLSL